MTDDPPCVDGCGQDAATIERLRERLTEAVEMVAPIERAVERSAYNCTCQVGGVDAMSVDTDWLRETARRLRAALAPQNHPRSAVATPEAPGQPGRAEEGSGGRTARRCGACRDLSDTHVDGCDGTWGR